MTERTVTDATNERPAGSPGVDASGPLEHAMGGAYEGADRVSRELATWSPVMKPPDAEINRDKMILDARGRDLVRNSGLMMGASAIHKDSIVGGYYRLNAEPKYLLLGQTKKWAEEFAREVEAKFTLYAESQDNWLDAARMNSLTMQVRLAIAGYFSGGEVLATVEWLRDSGRPFNTALQMIDPDRLSNPNDLEDTDRLRRGVLRNQYGAPQGYHIRMAHPKDQTAFVDQFRWKYVPVRKPWGRLQVIHLIEQDRPDQTRGVAAMVSVLKEMQMTRKFHDVTLQNAIVNASYAATIESDMPPDMAFESVGVTKGDARLTYAQSLMMAMAEYSSKARNLTMDGAKIPHLYPGTKLNLKPAGSIGGVGEGFEQSLLRYVASALGLSYEQFSRDYTKTNYSSARASMNETWKFMQSRKKIVADRYATIAYSLWLEEAINKGEIKSLPQGFNLYEGQNKDAICNCSWIGASRGQVDELKETQAAVMRIKAGLSTLAYEAAKLGHDWRELLEQLATEQEAANELGVTLNFDPAKGGSVTNDAGNEDGDAADDNKPAPKTKD
jgi:lambda family phage portal protein